VRELIARAKPLRTYFCRPLIVHNFVKLFAALLGLCLLPGVARAQTINQYTNTTVGAITDSTTCAVNVTRVIPVATSYVVGDVNFGVLLSHTYRSDLRISLTSPAGTTVQLLLNTGGSVDNLNVLFDDEAAAAIATHTTVDTVGAVPPYLRTFKPNAVLSAFDGQNALGNWTMVICDSVAVDSGSFTRADLYITVQQVSVTKISSVVSDGVSPSNPKAIPGATIRYCILFSNLFGATATGVSAVDPVPATMTYVPGSMTSGANCAGASTVEDDNAAGADETDPFGASVSGSTITASAPTLAAGSGFAVSFLTTVN
jgi:uncharacterized repeat protein (TIGR01451 family)